MEKAETPCEGIWPLRGFEALIATGAEQLGSLRPKILLKYRRSISELVREPAPEPVQ